ncbi:MAG: FtsK/SpoIIIE domain-containing protein [Defluviitaleaceae bacterium]|nr:FtsK/SpoIIIE domain-containing protein [Defluviitaleaceae bacterium]
MYRQTRLEKIMHTKILIELLKLFWVGTYKVSRENPRIGIMYACMVIVTILAGLITGNWGWRIFVIFCIGTALGIWQFIKDAPMRKKRIFFEDVFITMDFRASDSLYPMFIYETDVSEYTTVFSFSTLIPEHKWKSRKSELEMYFNEKIIDIKQNTNDNRIINVYVQLNPLPDYIEWSDKYFCVDNILAIGIDYLGVIGLNLKQHPHAFIAGETGSGKSNILKSLIYQALVKDYEVALIDFKRGVSFSAFSDYVKIHFDYKDVAIVLQAMVAETHSRLDKFRSTKVDNIDDYNQISGNGLKRKIIFIDELAELLKTRDKETANALNDSIETLTRLSRAAGIHLIMGIQRPDSTIVSGQIKNNVSFRVCGRFVDREPSRIMLSCDAASALPNIKGRFIVKDDNLWEVQSFYFPPDMAIPQDIEKRQSHGIEEKPKDSIPPQEEVMDIEQPQEKTMDAEQSKPPTSEPINFDFSGFNK